MTLRSLVKVASAEDLLEETFLLDKVAVAKPTIRNSVSPSFNRKIVPQPNPKGRDVCETASLSTKLALIEPPFHQDSKEMAPDKFNKSKECPDDNRIFIGESFGKYKDKDEDGNESNYESGMESDSFNDNCINGDLDDILDTTNLAARSAMFEYLSDNLDNLQTDKTKLQGHIESSNLRSFEKLTSEVVKDSCNDRSLLAILKTNGWTGSRYRDTPTTTLNPNSLLLAFLNLHLSRKAIKQNLSKQNDRKSLRNLICRGESDRGQDGYNFMTCNNRNNNDKNNSVGINGNTSDQNEKNNLDMDGNMKISNDEDEDLYYDQIQSFCPNILLRHLQ